VLVANTAATIMFWPLKEELFERLTIGIIRVQVQLRHRLSYLKQNKRKLTEAVGQQGCQCYFGSVTH